MPGRFGLQTSVSTWFLFAGLSLLWLASVRLVPKWRQDGWPSLLKSFFGFAWLGFAADILLRFSMLSYNAVDWANGSLRLAGLAPNVVNTTLAYCGLYWLFVSVGFGFASRRNGPGPISHTKVFTPRFAYSAAIPIALLASAAFCLTEGSSALPLVLLTPLALLANLYIVPAAVIWWDHFRQPGPKWRIGAIHVIVLLPAVVRAWRSPYRENLAPVFLVPLIAAVFAGWRPQLRKLIPVALLCFIASTALIGSYRQIKWESIRAEEVAREWKTVNLSEWMAGKWGEPLSRFHAFDSTLLTVALVPSMQPHSGREVLLDPFVRGFIPRFIYGSKGAGDQGLNFAARIWAFDNPTARENPVGSIAPSMPGDLFDAGGVLYLALGGLIWGVVAGLVDGWKNHLPGFSAAAIVALVATHCAMSVERDFDHTVAAFIQSILVLALAAGIVVLSRRRLEPSAAPDYDNFTGSLRHIPISFPGSR